MFDPDFQRGLEVAARQFSDAMARINPAVLRSIQDAGRERKKLVEVVAASTAPILEALENVDWDTVAQIVRELERISDPRTVKAFTFLDLVPSPTTEQQFIGRIVEGFEAGTDHDDLIRVVLKHYDEDNCDRIGEIVERLVQSPDFREREDVLNQVVQAHRAGLDSITTYPLVAMIEGVIVTALGEYVDDPKRELKHGRLAKYFGQMPVTFTIAVVESLGRVDGLNCLLNSMEASLYHTSHWGESEVEVQNVEELNRHRLLHGRSKAGTRLNTIRCLLILDLLADLLPATRRFLDEQLPNERGGTTTDD